MNNGPRLTPAQFAEILHCDTGTGKLFWLPRAEKWFEGFERSAAWECSRWNSSYADTEAFTALNNKGYKHSSIFGRDYYAHRIVFAIIHGEWPNLVDHINGVKTDNRPKNLRSVSHSENNRNMRLSQKNVSGCHGVVRTVNGQKWHARMNIDGKTLHLGTYSSLKDAVEVRKRAEQKHGFHANHGRPL